METPTRPRRGLRLGKTPEARFPREITVRLGASRGAVRFARGVREQIAVKRGTPSGAGKPSVRMLKSTRLHEENFGVRFPETRAPGPRPSPF